MSDDWITLVPRQTGFVPEQSRQEALLSAFRELAPKADEIELVNSDSIEFFDCGSNFEAAKCPHCQSGIDLNWWSERMVEDYVNKEKAKTKPQSFLSRLLTNKKSIETMSEKVEQPGFRMLDYEVPCSRKKVTLDALVYEWPQAFGRFALSAMNPNIGVLQAGQISRLEAELGCEITVIYQHL